MCSHSLHVWLEPQSSHLILSFDSTWFLSHTWYLAQLLADQVFSVSQLNHILTTLIPLLGSEIFFIKKEKK